MSTEWQTVPVKKAYVPPHQRKQVAAKAAEAALKDGKLNLTDKEAFPALGGAAVKKSWGGEKTFKQTIDDLIAYERLSAAEKLEREEAARAMEGWEVLYLPKGRAQRRAVLADFAARQEFFVEDQELLYHSMLTEKRIGSYQRQQLTPEELAAEPVEIEEDEEPSSPIHNIKDSFGSYFTMRGAEIVYEDECNFEGNDL